MEAFRCGGRRLQETASELAEKPGGSIAKEVFSCRFKVFVLCMCFLFSNFVFFLIMFFLLKRFYIKGFRVFSMVVGRGIPF